MFSSQTITDSNKVRDIVDINNKENQNRSNQSNQNRMSTVLEEKNMNRKEQKKTKFIQSRDIDQFYKLPQTVSK